MGFCNGCLMCLDCPTKAIKLGLIQGAINTILIDETQCICCRVCARLCMGGVFDEFITTQCSSGSTIPQGGYQIHIGESTGNGGGSGGDNWGHNQVGPQTITSVSTKTVQAMIDKYGTQQAVCNYGVQDAFNRLFPGRELNGKRANEIVQYWLDTPDKWERIKQSSLQATLDTVQQLANDGWFVVAGWQNNSSGRNGHVVVIVPGELQYSYGWEVNVPQAMATGYKMRSISQGLHYSFGKNKKDNIYFFKYK